MQQDWASVSRRYSCLVTMKAWGHSWAIGSLDRHAACPHSIKRVQTAALMDVTRQMWSEKLRNVIRQGTRMGWPPAVVQKQQSWSNTSHAADTDSGGQQFFLLKAKWWDTGGFLCVARKYTAKKTLLNWVSACKLSYAHVNSCRKTWTSEIFS